VDSLRLPASPEQSKEAPAETAFVPGPVYEALEFRGADMPHVQRVEPIPVEAPKPYAWLEALEAAATGPVDPGLEGIRKRLERAEDRPLAPGDVVRLKSGGPAMTICVLKDDLASTDWMVDGERMCRVFPAVCLERCEPDQFLGAIDLLEVAPGDILLVRVPPGAERSAEHAMRKKIDRLGLLHIRVMVMPNNVPLSIIRPADDPGLEQGTLEEWKDKTGG